MGQIYRGTISTFPPTPPFEKEACLVFLSLEVAFSFFSNPLLLQTQVTPFQGQSGENFSRWSHSVGTATSQEPRQQRTAPRVTQHSLNTGNGAA